MMIPEPPEKKAIENGVPKIPAQDINGDTPAVDLPTLKNVQPTGEPKVNDPTIQNEEKPTDIGTTNI